MSPQSAIRTMVIIAGSLCLSGQAMAPAFAQDYFTFPGDMFSSSGIASNAAATKRDCRLKPEPLLTFDWKPTPKREDNFDGSLAETPVAGDPFFINEETTRALSDFESSKEDPFLRVSTETLGTAPPVLMGWTNGTVVRRGTKYSVVGRVFSSSAPDKIDSSAQSTAVLQGHAAKIVKTDVGKNVSPLRKTLHDIWLAECKFQPFGMLPTKAQMWELKNLYSRAAQLEPHPVMKNYYRFMAQMAVENIEGAWKEVVIASKLAPGNKELFESFADEFKYVDRYEDAELLRDIDLMRLGKPLEVRRYFTTGMRAIDAHQWNTAWTALERIYAMAPEDDVFARKVALEYALEGRDPEVCVWLTRYLRVAKDWSGFDSAYQERCSIELRNYLKYLEKEPKVLAHWNAKRLPIKICFPTDSAEPLSSRDWQIQVSMQEALMDWMFVVPGKLDYIVVDDEKSADLVVVREKRKDGYSGFVKTMSLKDVPQEVPHPPALAETYTKRIGDEIQSARIVFYEDGSESDWKGLKELCLHETGHALGLLHHSPNLADIMYGIKAGPDKLDLSKNDKDRVLSLYKNHPLNKLAVEKYLGLEAICHRLDEPVDMHVVPLD